MQSQGVRSPRPVQPHLASPRHDQHTNSGPPQCSPFPYTLYPTFQSSPIPYPSLCFPILSLHSPFPYPSSPSTHTYLAIRYLSYPSLPSLPHSTNTHLFLSLLLSPIIVLPSYVLQSPLLPSLLFLKNLISIIFPAVFLHHFHFLSYYCFALSIFQCICLLFYIIDFVHSNASSFISYLTFSPVIILIIITVLFSASYLVSLLPTHWSMQYTHTSPSFI